MKAVLKVVILSLVFISCRSSNDTADDQVLTFDLSKLPEVEEVKLSDLGFVDIEYIQLETNNQSLLSRINTIEFGENFLIPYRFVFIDSIPIFDYSGIFKTNFVKRGNGPNGMSSINDIKVEKESQQIYVSSASLWGFNVYSETGEFIRTFKIPIKEVPDNVYFSIINDKIICYYTNTMGEQEFSYTIMDLNGNLLKVFPTKFPFKNYKSYGIMHENFFYKYNNNLYVKEVYSDTIYLFNEEKLKFEPHMVIDVGDRLITTEVRSSLDPLEIAKNYINPWYLFEFGDYIFYGFTYEFIVKFPQPGEKTYGYIGSKKSDFQVLYNLEDGIVNDLDGGPNFMPLTTKDDNTVVSVIDAFKLKNYVSSNEFKNSIPKYPKKKKELEKLAASLKETDNPVLVLAKLKK